MNLRVVHLLRKVERIDRDIEELEALLGTLQMDREYSARLRDSLVEESFRLRQLKQRINAQVIRIPPHFEAMLSDGRRPETPVRPEISRRTTPDTEQEKPRQPVKATVTAPAEAPEPAAKPAPARPVQESKTAPDKAANGKETAPAPGTAQKNYSSKKRPPFLFRFE